MVQYNYILRESSSDYVKFGISDDVARDMREYQLGNPRKIECIYERISIMKAPYVTEYIYRELKAMHIGNGWFVGGNSTIKLLKKCIMRANGAILLLQKLMKIKIKKKFSITNGAKI